MTRSKDLYFSILVTALSGFLTAQSYTYEPESAVFPKFLGALMTIFSLMMLFRAIKAHSAGEAAAPSKPAGFRIAAAIFAASFAYIAGIQYVGYFVSTTIFLVLSMIGFGEKRPLPIAAATLVFMGVIYVLFISFLGLRLPTGLLF